MQADHLMYPGRILKNKTCANQTRSRRQIRPHAVCKKCRGLMARDRVYQYAHHHEECRTRMEALMREDAGFRHRVENADICMTQRIGDVLKRRDREEHERKRPRFVPEQPNGSAQDHNVKGHPPENAEQVQSESQGGASPSGIPTEEDVVI